MPRALRPSIYSVHTERLDQTQVVDMCIGEGQLHVGVQKIISYYRKGLLMGYWTNWYGQNVIGKLLVWILIQLKSIYI